MTKRIVVFACFLLIATASGIWALMLSRHADAELAMAELQVSKMTCGSCVETISDALFALNGVRAVDVSVTTGRGQVAFDPAKVTADTIAATVTSSGYPAVVSRQLSPEQYQALQSETERLAEIYVARIDGRLLSREEFDAEVNRRLAAVPQPDQPGLREQVVAQLWPGLKQRLLLLAAAERNGIVVQDGEVDLRIRQMEAQQPDLDGFIRARFGSRDDFVRQVREELIIQRNIEDHVLAGAKDPSERRERFNRWLQEVIGQGEVVIYDAQLRQAGGAAGGGCGGGCCSKSG